MVAASDLTRDFPALLRKSGFTPSDYPNIQSEIIKSLSGDKPMLKVSEKGLIKLWNALPRLRQPEVKKKLSPEAQKQLASTTPILNHILARTEIGEDILKSIVQAYDYEDLMDWVNEEFKDLFRKKGIKVHQPNSDKWVLNDIPFVEVERYERTFPNLPEQATNRWGILISPDIEGDHDREFNLMFETFTLGTEPKVEIKGKGDWDKLAVYLANKR